MTLLKFLLTIALLLVAAACHEGMIEDDYLRDVGAVYRKSNYRGNKNFLLETKQQPTCMPLGQDVMSITVCKEEVKCLLFTGPHCLLGNDKLAVAVSHGDKPDFSTPAGTFFRSYLCRCDGIETVQANYTIAMLPHDSSIN